MNLRSGPTDRAALVAVIGDAVVAIVGATDDPAVLREYVRRYLAETDSHELDWRPVPEIARIIATHWQLGARSETPVAVVAVPIEGQQPATALLIVMEDAPFLVDSVHAALTERGLGIHLTIHPMLEVRRDAQGAVTDVGGPDGVVEAWTMIEFDACGAAERARLEHQVTAVLADVRASTGDREPMRQRAVALASMAGRSGTPEAEIAARFLTWLTRQRFVFLGAAHYSIDGSGRPTVEPGSGLGLLAGTAQLDPPRSPDSRLLSISRTDAVSTVHRHVRMTCVALRTFDGDRVVAEDRLVGLFSSAALRESVAEAPLLRERTDHVLHRAGFPAESHGGRAVRSTLETLPREALFEIGEDDLFELTMGIVALQERDLVRVFAVPEPGDRHVWVPVFVPRWRFTARVVDDVARLVADAFEGTAVSVETAVGSSALARLDVLVRRSPDTHAMPPVERLEAEIDRLTVTWRERLEQALHDSIGDALAHDLLAAVGDAIPDEYQAVVEPDDAVEDLRVLAGLGGDGRLRTSLRRRSDRPDEYRFGLYRRGEPVTLSAVLPLLEHLGVEVVDQRPFTFDEGGAERWLSAIGIRAPHEVELTGAVAAEFQATFLDLFEGRVENDRFNRLVVVAGLRSREIAVLRAYAKYLRQLSFPYSQQSIESMLVAWPGVARSLSELFTARFDPDLDGARTVVVAALDAELAAALDAIPSLDDDRIGRALLGLIRATDRTNAFRPADDGGHRPVLSFKLDPERIPDMPLPRPVHEIFVSSPRVEGVHLRGGRIARGGIRWSDRREDFRTEILGLMKAQMVKNAVIVPAGAKGGFVVKQPPASPELQRAETAECYAMFVAGLLDVTDDIVGDRVVPPERTVRYDGDDPYLVVAADKGTATFSDLANSISARYGFWLGDAFASGGSAGYDHKAMGITARGAWESVRRHATTLGLDADRDPLTVVGIGDMSGDVFGNGMLLSSRLRLLAAFDHRHVFLDPDPDPAASSAERRRLFGLPRSSWADYDPTLISAGGGVFPRSAKLILLSDEVRDALGISASALAPSELISALLRAPVDLLWNGGIGTYVKASTETHLDVGDRSNDSVRVDGSELRCRIVGEGGNLGFTQRGRVEFALTGGLINTDAIDNSAGVDCSDHEVNIKILLDAAIAAGRLDPAARNPLLASMTDEIAELVLADNRAQTRALGIARTQAGPMANVHARYLDQLQFEGWIDRELEFLPSAKVLAERRSVGGGLTVPELAVVFANTKIANIVEIVATDFADDPYFEPDLVSYFPSALRERFRDAILRHRLRREIVVTTVVNQMVNLSGTSFDHRMTEETGASSSDVLRAWVAARDIFGLPGLWAEIEAASIDLDHGDQTAMFLDARRMVERGVMWLLRRRRPPLDIAATVAEFRPGVTVLLERLAPLVRGPLADQLQLTAQARAGLGVPGELADRSAVWSLMHTAFDTVELAARHGVTPELVAGTYWHLFDRLDVTWLWQAVGALPRDDRWETHARAAVRDELLSAIADLVDDVLGHGGDPEAWAAEHSRAVETATSVFGEIRRQGEPDLTTVTVALRQLRNLVVSTARRQEGGPERR